MLRFLISVIFVVLSFSLYSSVTKRLFINTQSTAFCERKINIEEITNGTVTEEMFYSLPKRAQDDSPQIKLLISDSQVYALEHCRLNVWKWEKGSWINKYKFTNKGLCISNYYLKNGQLIGFTSDGFWFSQSAIYIFSENIGGWELLNVENEVPSFLSSANFRLGKDTIVSFVSGVRKNGEVSFMENNDNYAFSLKTNKWFKTSTEYNLNLFKQFFTGTSFDMKNTFHALNANYYLILDKNTKQLYYNNIPVKFEGVYFYYNDCSETVVFLNSDEVLLKDKVKEGAELVGRLKFKSINTQEGSNFLYDFSFFWLMPLMLLVLFSGILLGLLLKRVKRKKKHKSENDSTLLAKVIGQSGNSLTSDELDELLEIDEEVNVDSRRVKRSRIVQEINLEYMKMEGKELILRTKDPKDKRYILYIIES
jgi:hypothetical protein